MMETYTDIAVLRNNIAALKAVGQRIGFVPTMGALHEGHLSLIRRSAEDNDATVVSIFVNPTQFDDPGDLDAYPRSLEQDLTLAESAGTIYAFTPTAETMYPNGLRTMVVEDDLSRKLEGEHRPGHFSGVLTIVNKLFNVVQPDRAYFGQKDFQQCLLVQNMVRDLDLPIEVVMCPIVREADGLAMSSRNRRLDKWTRPTTTLLHEALSAAQADVDDGVREVKLLVRTMNRILIANENAVIDYIRIVDPVTLDPIEILETEAVALLAVRFGDIRLIDNRILTG
jgi:pantoate--beta-alanine ligase